MIEVAPKLWVGSDDEHKIQRNVVEGDFAIVHACKEPYHRDALGYTSRGAPKDHPEYLYAARGDELCLNLVDAHDPAYIPAELIDYALAWIEYRRNWLDMPVLIHCNQGHSRAPVLAMLYLAPELPPAFEAAEQEFKGLYPRYAPATGMREYARQNWTRYNALSGVEAGVVPV